jgi:hypothetical protein
MAVVRDPSRETSTVWFARLTMCPVLRTRAAGLGTALRVRSFRIWNTSSSARPSASSSRQPVNSSATAFIKVTRPRASVVITASPMLRSSASSL